MRSFIFGKGWWNESFRHSLAAKGVRSSLFSKISAADKIFPTAFEKIRRAQHTMEGGLNEIRAEIQTILLKDKLTQQDKERLMALYMAYFDMTTKESGREEEWQYGPEGRPLVMNPITRDKMLYEMAEARVAQDLEKHETYKAGIELELFNDVDQRITDMYRRIEKGSTPEERANILREELTSISSDLLATKRAYGLSYDENKMKELLRSRITDEYKTITPELILNLAERRGTPFVKPVRFGELQPVSEKQLLKERQEARTAWIKSLTPEQMEEPQVLLRPYHAAEVPLFREAQVAEKKLLAEREFKEKKLAESIAMLERARASAASEEAKEKIEEQIARKKEAMIKTIQPGQIYGGLYGDEDLYPIPEKSPVEKWGPIEEEKKEKMNLPPAFKEPNIEELLKAVRSFRELKGPEGQGQWAIEVEPEPSGIQRFKRPVIKYLKDPVSGKVSLVPGEENEAA